MMQYYKKIIGLMLTMVLLVCANMLWSKPKSTKADPLLGTRWSKMEGSMTKRNREARRFKREHKRAEKERARERQENIKLDMQYSLEVQKAHFAKQTPQAQQMMIESALESKAMRDKANTKYSRDAKKGLIERQTPETQRMIRQSARESESLRDRSKHRYGERYISSQTYETQRMMRRSARESEALREKGRAKYSKDVQKAHLDKQAPRTQRMIRQSAKDSDNLRTKGSGNLWQRTWQRMADNREIRKMQRDRRQAVKQQRRIARDAKSSK